MPAYDATEVVVSVWRALEGGRFEDDDLVGVLQGMREVSVRDAAWGSMTRDEAPAHVVLWTDAVQRSPDDLVGGPAAVLALAAWLAGNGALAWCAVDRCLDSDPDNSLAGLVGEMLSRAVPPSSWEEARRLQGLSRARRSGLASQAWVKRSTHRSSPGRTGPATARRSAAASTCSRGCCGRHGSTPTTR